MLRENHLETKMAIEDKKQGIKVGSPQEAAWTEILEAQIKARLNAEINGEIAKLLIDLADEKIKKYKL